MSPVQICIHYCGALHVARNRLCSSLVGTPGLQRPTYTALLCLMHEYALKNLQVNGDGGSGDVVAADVFTAPVVAVALRKYITDQTEIKRNSIFFSRF